MKFADIFNQTNQTKVHSSLQDITEFVDIDILEPVQISEKVEKTPEQLLINNNVKIKKKFETKFGTEFILAKKYDDNTIKEILKDFRVTFDELSIFVTK